MIRDVLLQGHQTESHIKLKKREFHTQQAQEMIYQFLLEFVRKQPPEEVLLEFRNLFLEYNSSARNGDLIKAVSELISSNNEKEFIRTLKRSCYILINNWD